MPLWIVIPIAAWAAVVLLVLAMLRASSRADDAYEAALRAEGLPRAAARAEATPGATLARLLEVALGRDPALGRHAAAVAYHARRLATAAGLTARDQDLVHTAGLLHDIDEPNFADSLAVAEHDLDAAARALAARHASRGVHVLRELPGLEPVADVVAACHEHVDGSGLPRGRRGEEIPYAARIVAVAESYDLLAGPNGRAASAPEAERELRHLSGRRLDGTLVELFLARVVDHAVDEPAPFRTRLRDELSTLRHSGIAGS